MPAVSIVIIPRTILVAGLMATLIVRVSISGRTILIAVPVYAIDAGGVLVSVVVRYHANVGRDIIRVRIPVCIRLTYCATRASQSHDCQETAAR
jgi:hypothetical protein